MESSSKENTQAPFLDDVRFLWKNAFCNVKITHDEIRLISPTTSTQPQSKKFFDKSIKLVNVISATYKRSEWKVNSDGQPILGKTLLSFLCSTNQTCFELTINVWEKEAKHRRKLEAIKLLTKEEKDCKDWHEKITNELSAALKKEGHARPRNLLVFINPYGGKKNAVQVYTKIASPIFKMAGIKETIVVTKYANHAKEYLQSEDTSSYDGIVAVGGDGMFNEIVNGVLITEQQRQNISLNLDVDGRNQQLIQQYSKPRVRLGLIAAGSGNFLNWVSQGTNETVTGVLHIVCGESHSIDVASTHDNDGKFMEFSASSTNFGFIANILHKSENLRILGPFRYEVTILRMLIQKKTPPYKIAYLESSPDNPVDVKHDTSRCRYPCDVCVEWRPSSTSASAVSNLMLSAKNERIVSVKSETNEQSDVFEEFEDPNTPQHLFQTNVETSKEFGRKHGSDCNEVQNEAHWKVVSGRFFMINAYTHSNMYDKAPNGLARSAHLSDGTADLILTYETSRSQFVNHIGVLRGTGNPYDYNFVDAHRVKAYRIQEISEKQLHEENEKRSDRQEKYSWEEIQKQFLSIEQYAAREESSHIWSNDGDVRKGSMCTGFVHRGLIDFFAKGIESDK